MESPGPSIPEEEFNCKFLKPEKIVILVFLALNLDFA
jgi:hypothetical protein